MANNPKILYKESLSKTTEIVSKLKTYLKNARDEDYHTIIDTFHFVYDPTNEDSLEGAKNAIVLSIINECGDIPDKEVWVKSIQRSFAYIFDVDTLEEFISNNEDEKNDFIVLELSSLERIRSKFLGSYKTNYLAASRVFSELYAELQLSLRETVESYAKYKDSIDFYKKLKPFDVCMDFLENTMLPLLLIVILLVSGDFSIKTLLSFFLGTNPAILILGMLIVYPILLSTIRVLTKIFLNQLNRGSLDIGFSLLELLDPEYLYWLQRFLYIPLVAIATVIAMSEGYVMFLFISPVIVWFYLSTS